METTTVVQDAVEALNKQNQEVATAEAVRYANSIRDKRSQIDNCNKRIADLQVDINKVAKDVITENTIFGGTIPANANRETLAKVVEEGNKRRQGVVESTANKLRDAIVSEQDQIVMLEKAIKDLQEKLLAIKVPTVTVQQIAG